MRLSVAITAGLFAVSSAANAETLYITAVYPAGSDAAASVQSIAVEDFGGSDGPALSLKLEDLLRDVYVEKRAWFTVAPASGGAQVDAILRGSANADVSFENIKLTRKRCQTYDENKKCTEYKDVEVDCKRRTVVLNYAVRLLHWQGELLYRADGAPQQQLEYCPRDDDNVKTVEATVTELLAPIASGTRYSLAPSWERREMRVMETRKGLKGVDSNAFKAAVALTKSDPNAACSTWEQLAATVPDNPSNEVNRGLCAEMRGDLDASEGLYRHALQLMPKADYASDGLRRIAARRHAVMQMAAHWGE